MASILLYNFHYGTGISTLSDYFKPWKEFNAPPQLLTQLIQKIKSLSPDVVGFAETDSGSPRTRGLNQAEHFAKQTGLSTVEQKCKYGPSVLSRMPYFQNQGNTLLSKYPFQSVTNYYFSTGTKKLVLHATLKTPLDFSLFLVHLSLGKSGREKQLVELSKWVQKSSEPILVLGDFNTELRSPQLRKFLSQTNLKSALSSEKTYPTWNPTKSFDNILYSSTLTLKKSKVLNWDFSDHLPVVAEFK